MTTADVVGYQADTSTIPDDDARRLAPADSPSGQPSSPTTTRRVDLSWLVWVLPSLLVTLLVVVAAAPGLFTGRDPLAADLVNALRSPSGQHWFGTDELGRDVYARVIYGARDSLWVGVAATLISLAFGAVFGVVAGVFGGVTDRVIARLADVLLAFPAILLAMLAVTVLGPSTTNLALAIGIAHVPSSVRLVRSQVMLVARSGYVEAALTLGRPRWVLVVRHILPNSIRPLLVVSTIGVGSAIITAAALTYIGLGAQPPAPQWGVMLADAQRQLPIGWWLGLFPGLVLLVSAISITALGQLLLTRYEGGRR